MSYDIIPAISDNPGAADAHADAVTAFGSTYSNTGTHPFPAPNAFADCDGAVDGDCNSGNIHTLYDSYQTNYGIGSSPHMLSNGPTPQVRYAAGLCKATINGYSDWYLPAACEVSGVNGSVACPAGAQSISRNLAFLLGDSGAASPPASCSPPSGTSCLAGLYWTSTTYSVTPLQRAWAAQLSISGDDQLAVDKSTPLGVRCVRTLTP